MKILENPTLEDIKIQMWKEGVVGDSNIILFLYKEMARLQKLLDEKI